MRFRDHCVGDGFFVLVWYVLFPTITNLLWVLQSRNLIAGYLTDREAGSEGDPACALPEFMPSVIIHAPVVSAALTRPWLKASLRLEDILKFWIPPWTEITSFGSSIFHSFNIKCNRCSEFVSQEVLMYWKDSIHPWREHRATCKSVEKMSTQWGHYGGLSLVRSVEGFSEGLTSPNGNVFF